MYWPYIIQYTNLLLHNGMASVKKKIRLSWIRMESSCGLVWMWWLSFRFAKVIGFLWYMSKSQVFNINLHNKDKITVISMYIQEYHRKGYLVTEQQVSEHNLIFDLITTTVPNKETSEVVAEVRHKPSETNITWTTLACYQITIPVNKPTQ